MIEMQVTKGVALAIRAAYESGAINFETYSEIRKKYNI